MTAGTESSPPGTATRDANHAWSFARRAAGATMLLAAMAQYRSTNHPTILGRWSPQFVAIACVVALAMVAYVARSARALARRGAGARELGPAAVAGEIAFLVWSAGYLAETLVDSVQGAALADGNIIGALSPVASFLEWLALPIAFVALAHLGARLPAGLKNAALVVGTFVAMAIIGEGVARVAAHVSPQVQGYPTHRGIIWHRRFVRLNSSGFRDAQQSPTNPIVAVIGDSYAFGAGIADPKNRFGEKLVDGLHASTGAKWSAVNASQGDKHTLQEFAMMDSVLRFRPDVVILLYVFNDIDYLRPVTKRLRGTQADRIVDRLHPARFLYLNSYLYTELSARLNQLQALRSTTVVDPYADSLLVEKHLADVRTLLAKSQGVARLTLMVPFDISVTADPQLRKRYDRFVCAAERAGLPVINAADAFTGREFSTLRVSPLDRHPNELANALLAARVLPLVTQRVSGTALATPLPRACAEPLQ